VWGRSSSSGSFGLESTAAIPSLGAVCRCDVGEI
jgi:hypothetical protein